MLGTPLAPAASETYGDAFAGFGMGPDMTLLAAHASSWARTWKIIRLSMNITANRKRGFDEL